MNKAEMVESISAKTGLSEEDSKRSLDAFIESVKECMASGEEVGLLGFGKWKVSPYGPRKSRNPVTGERTVLPARNVVKFKVGSQLKDAANREKPTPSAERSTPAKRKNADKAKRKRRPARLRDLLR